METSDNSESESSGITYHIARDGKVIANYDFKTLYTKLKEGAVKPTDYYIIEGTTDWQLVDTLKSKFSAFEQEEKAKKNRLKEEAEQKAISDQAESARKRHQEFIESKKKDYVPWKCWTCATTFRSNGKANEFPDPSGAGCAFGLLFAACIFAVCATFAWPAGIIAGLLAIIAFVFLIAYGVESGLQQFHSYRPRCPQCSSPYCSKVEDGQPAAASGT